MELPVPRVSGAKEPTEIGMAKKGAEGATRGGEGTVDKAIDVLFALHARRRLAVSLRSGASWGSRSRAPTGCSLR